MITSTLSTIPGKTIIETKGVVSKIESSNYHITTNVLNAIVQQAEEMGANAIVGLSFAISLENTHGDRLKYIIMASGTAVCVE